MTISLIVLAVLGSGLFATLTYSLRDFSRARLATALEARKKERWLTPTLDRAGELAYLTAILRLLFNLVAMILALYALADRGLPTWAEYAIGAGATALVMILASVTVPHALAVHAGESIIAIHVRLLHMLRIVFRPLSKVLEVIERTIGRIVASDEDVGEKAEEELQHEILAVMEEGEKTGVVDEHEREMIESVIQFRDTAVAHVMTARPDIVGLPVDASLERIRGLMEESGHSRVPLYEGSLDHIVGVLYARDLLQYVGEVAEKFDTRAVMRAPFFVPESKPLRDLLQDFRLQKVHIAIVLDEYGGTAGLVTIEDVLEELVGEISDEHEPIEPAVFKRLDDSTAEVDAKIHVDELNRLLGTNLPEDAGYDTLGGFVSTHLGRIPPTGMSFEHDGAGYEILEAEPQRVTRVKVRLLPPVVA